jgi:cell division protein FtsQ
MVILFSEWVYSSQRCREIAIAIETNNVHSLLEKNDIRVLIAPNGLESPIGKIYKKINLNKLEEQVLRNKLVKSCQVHRGLSGVLTVDVEEYKPIARVVTGLSDGTTNSYVTEKGDFIGVSESYTPRVLLLTGKYFDRNKNLKEVKSKPLLELIQAINEDEFWKAQITQLIVEKDGGVTLIPEVGLHVIEFGMALEVEAKFRKLKVFYKKILSTKGWNAYRKVSVKYRNQIVCE